MSSIFSNIRTLGNAVIGGDLIVNGSNISVDSEIVQIADNHLYLNKNYETNAAQTGGLVVNTEPQVATPTTIAADGFASTTTVVHDNTITLFTAGDFIQVSGSLGGVNDGTYEVASHASSALTGTVTISAGTPNVVGSGTSFTTELAVGDVFTTTTSGETHIVLSIADNTNMTLATNHTAGEAGSTATYNPTITIQSSLTAPNDFTKNGFIADGTTGATITKIRLSIMRAGTDGIWETATGVTTVGLTFEDINGGTVAHGSTTGLGNDDHTQYALLAGRSVPAGGQTLIGGVTTLDDLTLQPNSIDTTGAVRISTSTVNSTSVSTGALIVEAGGLGVFLDIFAGGLVTATSGFVADGVSVFNKPVRTAITDDASTTAQTPLIGSLNAVTRFTGTVDFTYTLPDMTAAEDGMTLTFYKSGASGVITLAANAADTGLIEGSTVALTTQYDRLTIMYVNSDLRWIIV